MKTSTIVGIIIAIIIILGGWFWWMSAKAPQAPMETATTTAQTSQEQSSSTASSGSQYVAGNLLLGTDATTTLGTYLIADNGMTLYRYTKDTPGVSNCTGQCAISWPPYTVSSTDALANIQAGINGTVGSTLRADGTIQVTYNGSPLYFWVKDKQPGDTTGQNVGGVWFVVTP